MTQTDGKSRWARSWSSFQLSPSPHSLHIWQVGPTVYSMLNQQRQIEEYLALFTLKKSEINH